MSLFSTTCRLCRDFHDELACAGRALAILGMVVGIIALIVGVICLLVFACVEGDTIWPLPAILALAAYWGIYRDVC